MLRTLAAAAALAPGLGFAAAEPLTVGQFKAELMGVPLCGTPTTGPLAGKPLCTVYLPDGTAVVAGSGILVRGLWEADGDRVCRRSRDDPMERRRCVTYEQVDPTHYRNSDGVVACVGPCPAQGHAPPAQEKPAEASPEKPPENSPQPEKPQ